MMTKEDVKKVINSNYVEWKKEKDENISGMYEVEIGYTIIVYCADNNIQIPGYNLRELKDTFDRQNDDVYLTKDEEEIDLFRIYVEISGDVFWGKIEAPPEFLEINDYFNNLFWPDWPNRSE